MRESLVNSLKDPYVARWTFATGVNIAAVVVSATVFFGAERDQSPFDVSLDFALIALLLMIALAWNRFHLGWSADESKLSLAWGFHALLVAIGFNIAQNQTILDRETVLLPGILIGLVATAILLWRTRPLKPFGVPFSAAFMIFAACGLIQLANCQFDFSPGISLRTHVGGKFIAVRVCRSGGRYSGGSCWGRDAALLELSPAPESFPPSLDVSNDFYAVEHIGDSLCFVEHPGRLGARWFTFDRCPKGNSTQ